ncbi:MAG: AgmX/PglI C-terminal domain-containing protein [Deltaproteobacteria bacterium]|nr:AgmX/PglI C-terminal domain-containing protein [Deltaproteobacteria bacterium]
MNEKDSLKRRWIVRDDYPFFFILIISTVIHFSMVVYLNTIEIKKKELGEAIKGIPQRFARLILQPPQAVLKKAPLPLPQKKEEVKEEQRVAKKEVEPGTLLEKAVKADVKKDVGVRSKGLLGVIMAKGRPERIPGTAVFRDIDKVVKDINKVGPEDRVKDVLASLKTKGFEGIEEEAITVKAPSEGTPRDTGEIIKEKREVSLGEADKKRVVTDSNAWKRYDAEVYAAIDSYKGGLTYLYNNALRKDPSLKGRIKIKIVISSTGRAKEVAIVSSSLNSQELEEAIVNRIYMWRFPQFKGNETFTTVIPFDFAPIG